MAEDIKKVLFVDWCAKDVLEGTHMLEAAEDLAYRIIIDLIYSTNDKLPDDDKRLARFLGFLDREPAFDQFEAVSLNEIDQGRAGDAAQDFVCCLRPFTAPRRRARRADSRFRCRSVPAPSRGSHRCVRRAEGRGSQQVWAMH